MLVEESGGNIALMLEKDRLKNILPQIHEDPNKAASLLRAKNQQEMEACNAPNFICQPQPSRWWSVEFGAKSGIAAASIIELAGLEHKFAENFINMAPVDLSVVHKLSMGALGAGLLFGSAAHAIIVSYHKITRHTVGKLI